MKRLLTAGTALALVVCMPLSAFADTGVWGGGITDTVPAYSIDTDYAVVAYNNTADEDPYWEEVYPGSAIYFPVLTETEKDDGAWDYANATDKQIKEDNVRVTHKVTKGSQYVGGVSIVDIKKEKLKGLSSDAAGMWVKVKVSDSYASTRSTNVMMKLVLSVDRVSYQNTEVELGFDLVNRTVYIDRDSVYGAQVPTMFESDFYNGEASFDMGNGVLYTARVKSGGKYVINYVTDEIADVADMDPNAYMEFHRFLGSQDTFSSAGDLEIPLDTADFQGEDGKPKVHVYEYDGEQLTAISSDASYDKSAGILTIRTRTLGEYVLSSEKLLRDVTSSDSGDILQGGYATDASSSTAPPPPASSALAPAPTNTGGAGTTINAGNVSDGNPITGVTGGAMLPGMALTAALAAGTALAAWKRRPFAKKK